jgi:hypothetical protein
LRGRRIGVAALLAAATILWTVAALSVWVKRQAIDTDNWVDTGTELLEKEQVRTALSLWTMVVFAAAAFAWLEFIRRRVVDEFPDEPAPQLSLRRPARSGSA